MKNRIETQQFGTSLAVDFKAVSDKGEFEGYGSVFGNVDGGFDVVMPGAFAQSIVDKGASGIKMLRQHDTSRVIGVYDEVSEDERGLKVKGRLIMATQDGRETYELMKAGAIDGLSIGFVPEQEEYLQNDVRQIQVADLWEVSVVTWPMNSEARVDSVKSKPKTERDMERLLTRDAGFSRSEAKVIINEGFKALDAKRDAGTGDRSLEDIILRATEIIKS